MIFIGDLEMDCCIVFLIFSVFDRFLNVSGKLLSGDHAFSRPARYSEVKALAVDYQVTITNMAIHCEINHIQMKMSTQ